MTTILLIWLLLAKHYICDFPLQSKEMIMYKGKYGHPLGINHSLYHVIGTMCVLILFTDPMIATAIGIADGLLHYHIDWLKSNYGEKDIKTNKFWCHLGLDQLAHQFVYLTIAVVLL